MKSSVLILVLLFSVFIVFGQQTPYGGNPWPVPGTIECENFDNGGSEVAYHDSDTGGPRAYAARASEYVDIESDGGSGYMISYIEPGEWLEYTMNVTAGNYYVDCKVGSAEATGKFHIEFELDGDITGQLICPNTGGWTTFTTVSIGPFSLTGGQQVMKIVMDGRPFNFDKVTFRTTTEIPTPSPSPTPVPSASPDAPQVPVLHVEGKWIKDASGNNVVLRGFAVTDIDAIYKGSRKNFSTNPETTMYFAEILDLANDWNYSVVRLTVHPQVSDETGNNGWLNYTPDFYFQNILDPILQNVIGRGKYAIVDWHYVGAGYDDSTVVTNTTNFWNYIASKYANNPNVIFELFNEPGGGDWTSWKNRAQGWINSIRNTYGANNLILVGGPSWSQVMPQSSGDLLSSGNIVYVCHIYPGHISNGTPPNWIEYVSSVAPVMMTEWGYENNPGALAPVAGGTASNYGNPFKNYINGKTNVGWIAWCFDDAYRSIMFSRKWVLLGNGAVTNAADYFHYTDHPDGANPVADTNDNYMGYFTKNWLYEQRNNYFPIIGGGTAGPTNPPSDTLGPTDAPTATPAPTAVPTATPASTVTPAPTATPGPT